MIGRGTLALVFLVNVIFGLYTAAVMLRFLLQWVRADFYNPLSQAVVKLTNPPLKPLRRVIPGWRGVDFAALVLMLVLQLINVLLVVALAGGAASVPEIALWTVLKLIFILLNLYFFTILVEAVLSWVGPGHQHPIAGVLWQLNAPLLRPVQRILPPLGGLDFSPLVLMVVLQVLDILLPLSWPLI